MMSPDTPMDTQGPVRVTVPDNSPIIPFQTINAPNDGVAMRINRQDGTHIDFNNDGTITNTDNGQTNQVSGGGGGGGSSITIIFQPTTFPGQVMSGGPGMGPYNVNIYPQGITQPPLGVSVTQLQMSNLDTIPPGTWAAVFQIGSISAPTYYMMVPVWTA